MEVPAPAEQNVLTQNFTLEAQKFIQSNKDASFFLYLAYAASMMGVVLSTNLFEFYLFFELMIIPSWALINSYGSGDREKIALMYLLWSIVGAVVFVTGVFSAYALTGSFEISSLSSLIGSPWAGFVVATMILYL